MLMSLEEVTQNLTTADRSLLYHILVQQQETNRLLTQLVESKPQEAEAVNIDVLKRPQLMKMMKESKAPKGWVAWSNEKMVAHLKGAS